MTKYVPTPADSRTVTNAHKALVSHVSAAQSAVHQLESLKPGTIAKFGPGTALDRVIGHSSNMLKQYRDFVSACSSEDTGAAYEALLLLHERQTDVVNWSKTMQTELGYLSGRAGIGYITAQFNALGDAFAALGSSASAAVQIHRDRWLESVGLKLVPFTRAYRGVVVLQAFMSDAGTIALTHSRSYGKLNGPKLRGLRGPREYLRPDWRERQLRQRDISYFTAEVRWVKSDCILKEGTVVDFDIILAPQDSDRKIEGKSCAGMETALNFGLLPQGHTPRGKK